MKKYHIKTESFVDGKIIQDINLVDDGFPEGVEQLYRKVIDTSNQQIKEALMELGWTPPSS